MTANLVSILLHSPHVLPDNDGLLSTRDSSPQPSRIRRCSTQASTGDGDDSDITVLARVTPGEDFHDGLQDSRWVVAKRIIHRTVGIVESCIDFGTEDTGAVTKGEVVKTIRQREARLSDERQWPAPS